MSLRVFHAADLLPGMKLTRGYRLYSLGDLVVSHSGYGTISREPAREGKRAIHRRTSFRPKSFLFWLEAGILALSLATGVGCAQGHVTSQAQNRDSVGQYEKFELTFTLSATYANPFDLAEIDVRVTFTEPGGTQKVIPAFYYMEYDVVPGNPERYVNGRDPCWKARFAPTLVGEHSYEITVIERFGRLTVPGAKTFQCVASQRKGFIRVDPRDPFLLRRTTGEQYIPIGHNVAHADDYTGLAWWTNHFQKDSSEGANWARVWMSQICTGESIEGSPSGAEFADPAYWHGVGRYSLEIAWKLDHIVELAEQDGIAIQLTLQQAAQFSWGSPDWNQNPYNIKRAVDGGWLTNPKEFFTDAKARRLTQNKYRYIVARWGYSTAIESWELWNEVEYATDSWDIDRASVVAWHAEMAQFLHDMDPCDHPVTTSTTAGDYTKFDAIWSLPSIDLVQVHSYEPDIIATLQTSTKVLRKYGKPVFTGEFGITTDDPVPERNNWNSLPEPYHSQLLEGLHFHDGIWTAFHLKSSAGLWWWDWYIQELDLFGVYRPLAVYAEGEDLGGKGLSSATVKVTTQKQAAEPAFQPNAPGIQDFWGVPQQTTFTVDQQGQIGDFNKMTRYLQGHNHEDLRSDPIFSTNFDSASTLRLYVLWVSSPNESLDILVDGVVVASLTNVTTENIQVEAQIPAGAHNVQVKNTGPDYFVIGNYAFGIRNILRDVGLAGHNSVYLWIYDAGSQYGYTNNGTIDDATFNLSGLDAGPYVIQYYSTQGEGGMISSEQASVAGDGVLTGTVPSFSKDIAVKVKPINSDS